MVGAANSDSARISFFGSTKRELAQKLDRGKDAAGRRRLTQVPPEPREMVAYYTAHKLCLGWGYLLFVGGTAHAGPRGLLRGLPMHFLQSAMEPSSAPPSQKERTASGGQ